MLNNLEKQFVAYLFRLKAEGVLKKQNSLKDLNLSVSKTIMCFKSVGDTESAAGGSHTKRLNLYQNKSI